MPIGLFGWNAFLTLGMKALVVLARLPFTARVKPRLAAEITKVLATQFYRACAEHTIIESARSDTFFYAR